MKRKKNTRDVDLLLEQVDGHACQLGSSTFLTMARHSPKSVWKPTGPQAAWCRAEEKERIPLFLTAKSFPGLMSGEQGRLPDQTECGPLPSGAGKIPRLLQPLKIGPGCPQIPR